jgi:hypothetical protein
MPRSDPKIVAYARAGNNRTLPHIRTRIRRMLPPRLKTSLKDGERSDARKDLLPTSSLLCTVDARLAASYEPSARVAIQVSSEN